MINLQNPTLPIATDAIEIDKAIIEMQSFLSSEITWLTNGYGRAYKNLDIVNGNRLYFPEVYLGTQNNSQRYTNITPDNDKQGQCFFLVKSEDVSNYSFGNYSFLSYDVSIVFSVNLALINQTLLDTDYFLQNCIAEVRDVITRRFTPSFFTVEISSVDLLFSDVFSDFNLTKQQQTEKAPLAHFKINCNIGLNEDCINYDPTPVLPSDLFIHIDPSIGINSGNPIDGESIFLAADQSGNNNDFVQLLGGLQPSWNLSGINGLPTINFNTASYLYKDDVLLSTENLSFFIVLKRNGNQLSGGYNSFAMIGASTYLAAGMEYIHIRDGLGEFLFRTINGALNENLVNITSDTILISFVKSSTGVEYFINGVSLGINLGVQIIGGQFYSFGGWSGNLSNMELGEYLFWDRALNALETQTVHDILINKFAI